MFFCIICIYLKVDNHIVSYLQLILVNSFINNYNFLLFLVQIGVNELDGDNHIDEELWEKVPCASYTYVQGSFEMIN